MNLLFHLLFLVGVVSPLVFASQLVEKLETSQHVRIAGNQGDILCVLHAISFHHHLDNGKIEELRTTILYEPTSGLVWFSFYRTAPKASLEEGMKMFLSNSRVAIQKGKITVFWVGDVDLWIRSSVELRGTYKEAKIMVIQWLHDRLSRIEKGMLPDSKAINLIPILGRDFFYDPKFSASPVLLKLIQARPVGEKIEVEVKGPRYSEILTIDADLAVKHVRK